jgi:hypothetical protein
MSQSNDPGRPAFPLALPAPGTPAASYVLDPDRCALRDPPPAGLAAQVEDVLEHDGSLHIVRVPLARGGPLAGPVYRLGPGGLPFVPTGRVWARFRESIEARAQAAALEHAGYRLLESPVHAPHAAWLESLDRSLASALHGIDRLLRVDGVVHVEPEMISPLARR